MGNVFRQLAVVCTAICCTFSLAAQDLKMVVGWLRHAEQPLPVLSNLDPFSMDEGQAGAPLGLNANATMGKFPGQKHQLEIVNISPAEDPTPAVKEALSRSVFLLLDSPTDSLLAIADLPEAQSTVLFNAFSSDVELRQDNCRANLLYTKPATLCRRMR